MTENNNSKNKASKRPTKGKARFRRFIAVFAALVLVWWFNNYTLKTTTLELSSPKIKAPIRIFVISDWHTKGENSGIGSDTILRRLNKAEPDIVVMLGDMYTRNSEWELIEVPIKLAQTIVNDGYPVYCVTGDHDTSPKYVSGLEAVGAKVLSYETDIIEINGSRLRFFGIDNVYYSPTFDLHKAEGFEIIESCYNILLAHIPNYEDFEHFGADLSISADTHGDMVQLPFGLGPLYHDESGEWLPELFHKDISVYDKGLYPYDGGNLFITSGIGDSPFPIRFNNRPEVVVIDLIPE